MSYCDKTVGVMLTQQIHIWDGVEVHPERPRGRQTQINDPLL